jgi:magnesium transporter
MPFWLDIDSSQPDQATLLADVFHFHPLAIEDTTHPASRVKVDEYEDFLFITARAVRFCESTPDDPYDLETTNLYFFISPKYLVTVHAEPSESIEYVRGVLERNPDLFGRGPARLAHMILDNSVDAYFPILDQIDEFIDGLEDRVFAKSDDGALQDIFRVKRLVFSLRRYLAPQREVFNTLSNRPLRAIPPATQLYFRDIYDHMLRITDSLDNARELLSGTLDSYLSQVSNRLGRVTQRLSIIATITLPFVVMSGMWGMNIDKIPLSKSPHGFAIMAAVQLLIGLGLFAVIWIRRWF